MAKEIIVGFDSFDRKLAALGDPKLARKVIRGSMGLALTPVLKAARINVPKGNQPHKTYLGRIVSPGFASRSIKKKVKIIGNSIIGFVGLKKEAFYALFFETGTKYLEQDEWLEPSMTDNRREVLDKYGDSFVKWLRKVAAKK